MPRPFHLTHFVASRNEVRQHEEVQHHEHTTAESRRWHHSGCSSAFCAGELLRGDGLPWLGVGPWWSLGETRIRSGAKLQARVIVASLQKPGTRTTGSLSDPPRRAQRRKVARLVNRNVTYYPAATLPERRDSSIVPMQRQVGILEHLNAMGPRPRTHFRRSGFRSPCMCVSGPTDLRSSF